MPKQPSSDALYRTAGEALHVGQVLEVNVRTLISILNTRLAANLDADAIILAEDKRTLGRLIATLRPMAQFCPETEAALAVALSARNHIAHEFFIRHVGAFSNNEDMEEAMFRLHERQKEIVVATAITASFVEGFCKEFNIKLSDVLIRQDI